MQSSTTRTFLLLFAATFLAFVAVNWEFYFSTPIHEHGDIAVNALQIDQAKHLDELYGNYSRFQFNHPGPAFFYVYALGERVLCDWLHLDITPHNAHSLMGLLLQTAFFSLAIAIAASWVRSSFFIPMALLLGALHFTLAPGAVTSIWPPHVLLMPFLAFWVCATSVASGRGQHLPLVVLAGSFLVHGHVAQPMLVGGIFLGSYGIWFWSLRHGTEPKSTPWKKYPVAHGLSLIVLFVFLTPLVIDASKGADSNILGILHHLRDHSEERKKLSKSLLYFFSFFGYTENQDTLFKTLSWKSFSFFTDHVWAYLSWIGFFGLVGYLGRKRVTPTGALRHFLRTGMWLWIGTAVLCLIWGMLQTGDMFAYNGFFFYAVNYAALLLGCAIICLSLPQKTARITGIVLCAIAFFISASRFKLGAISYDGSGLPLAEAVQKALKADPSPGTPKVLVFEHDDWPEAASLGLALQRAGVTFYMDSIWQFMFQKRHTLPTSLIVDPEAKISVWRIVRDSVGPKGIPFVKGLKILFEPAKLSPENGTIDFSQRGNLELYQVCGFITPDGAFAWTGQADTALQFVPKPAEQDIELEIVAEPFLPKGKIAIQPTELRFNGKLVFAAPFTEPGVLRVRILKEDWNRLKVAHIHLHMPNAQSPSQLGLSGDLRVLSLAVKQLTTRYAKTPRP